MNFIVETERLPKRIRQMKPAGGGTGGQYYCPPVWRTGHAADRANIQKQTVRSNWRGWSRTLKLENQGGGPQEASQKK